MLSQATWTSVKLEHILGWLQKDSRTSHGTSQKGKLAETRAEILPGQAIIDSLCTMLSLAGTLNCDVPIQGPSQSELSSCLLSLLSSPPLEVAAFEKNSVVLSHLDMRGGVQTQSH